MFKKEFRNRTLLTQPTLLEKYALSEEDFDGLRNIKRVLEPFQKAQLALEGDKYVTMSLVPFLSIGAADPRNQNQLISLLDNMMDDFDSRWGGKN